MAKLKYPIKFKIPMTERSCFELLTSDFIGYWKFRFRVFSSGFTFIEVLTVVAVLAIIVGIIANGLFSFRRSADMARSADGIIAQLREARRRTVESRDGSAWGVHIENNHTILFKGVLYVAGAVDNEVFVLPSSVNLSGLSDVVFQRISGATDQWGTIILGSSSGASRTITIYASGLAE